MKRMREALILVAAGIAVLALACSAMAGQSSKRLNLSPYRSLAEAHVTNLETGKSVEVAVQQHVLYSICKGNPPW